MPKKRTATSKPPRPGLKIMIRLKPGDDTRFLNRKAEEFIEADAEFGRKLILEGLARREPRSAAASP